MYSIESGSTVFITRFVRCDRCWDLFRVVGANLIARSYDPDIEIQDVYYQDILKQIDHKFNNQ